MKKIILTVNMLLVVLLFTGCTFLIEALTIVTLEKVSIVDSSGNALEDAEMDFINSRNINHFKYTYGFELEYGKTEYTVGLGFREHSLATIRADVENLTNVTASYKLTSDDTHLTITIAEVHID